MSTAASYLRSRLSRDARGRATALARSWRGGAPRALAARARRAARVVVVPCVTEGHGTGKRPLSFGARLRCDVTAAASNAQPTFAWRARVRHCARCLLGGGAARALAARARRAALVVVALCTIKGHCTGRRAVSFCARPCCDVPSCSYLRKRLSRETRRHATALALSWGGGAARALAARARRAARTVVASFTTKCHCTSKRPLSFGARQCYDVRALCRAGWGRSAPYERALHRREASVLRRKVVLRRDGCAPLLAEPALTWR